MVPWQLTLLLSVSISFTYYNSELGLSVLMGGLIQMVPQVCFAKRVLKCARNAKPDIAVQIVYRAETQKVVLTSALFAVVFSLFKQCDHVALVMAFSLMVAFQCLCIGVTLTRVNSLY
jgi:F0F1-type ATP synthase assembly protein I